MQKSVTRLRFDIKIPREAAADKSTSRCKDVCEVHIRLSLALPDVC